MPHMPRTTDTLLLLLVSLASISNVAARALPQLPGSQSSDISEEFSDTSNLINIENENGNANLPQQQAQANLQLQAGEGGVQNQGGNGAGDVIEEEEFQSPDQTSLATAIDEYFEDAGFEPDNEALAQDLEGTSSRQPFDIAPESLTDSNPTLDQARAFIQQQIQAAQQNRQTDAQTLQANPATEIIEETQTEQGNSNPFRFDISGLPPLDPNERVTTQNERDIYGNLRILTEAPELEAEDPETDPAAELRERQRKYALRGENDEDVDAEFEAAARMAEQQKAADRARGIDIVAEASPRYRESLPKLLPEDQLPPHAYESQTVQLRNENGEIIDEWGFRLDENGMRIPETYEQANFDREVDEQLQGQENQATDTNQQVDQVTDAAIETEPPVQLTLTNTDKPQTTVADKLKRTSKYHFDPDLAQYLKKWGSVSSPLDLEKMGLDPEYLSNRNNIRPPSSQMQFRRPENPKGHRSQRQRNMANAVQWQKPVRKQNKTNFLTQPYVSNNENVPPRHATAEELQNAIRKTKASRKLNPLQTMIEEDELDIDPFTMPAKQLERLFKLQAENEARDLARALSLSQSRAQSRRRPSTSSQGPGLTTMALEAEAGASGGRVNIQGAQADAFGLNRPTNFSPGIFGAMPRTGGNLFEFDSNIAPGGLDNINTSLYGTDNNDYQEEEQTYDSGLQSAQKNADNMTDEEILDYLLKEGVPVGDDGGMYSIDVLRDLVRSLM